MLYSRPHCFALLYSIVYCIWLMITPSSAQCSGNGAPTEMGTTPQAWNLTSTDCGTASHDLLVTDPDSDALTGSFVTPVNGFSFQNTGAVPKLLCNATIISDAWNSSYTLDINVNDTCANTLNFQMTVTFSDIAASTNDNEPELSPLTVDVVRDQYETGGGSVTVNVTALAGSDNDGDDVASVMITATNPASAPFSIVPTGTTSEFTLQLTGSLASVTSPVTLTLDVVDSGTPPRTTNVALTVNIKERPEFTNPNDTDILFFCEDFVGGDVITPLAYTDADSTAGITFSVVNYDATNVPFEVDAATSELKVASHVTAGTFDIDALTSPLNYSVQLRVTDGTYESTITVTLVADDVNDNAPVISPSPIPDQNVVESLPAGSTILELTTSDGDRDAPNNVVTLSLSGTNSDHFVIDGNFLKLATPSPLNYTANQEYNLNVTATDGADPVDELTDVESIRIVVETAPVFEKPAVGDDPTEVPENTAANQTIYIFSASDKDTDATSLEYTIDAQDPSSPTPFEIVGNELKTKANLTADLLDVETTGTVTSYIMNVTVSDGTYTDSATLQLTIIDANDNNPAFNEGSYSVAINENTVAGTNILNVSATDADVTTVNKGITYSMTGTTHFAIDGATGEITVADPSMLNYTTHPSYTLNIVATDSGTPTLSGTVPATITIEASPILVRPAVGEDPTEIEENKTASELVYTFVSTDKDTVLADLTYTIVAQVPATPVAFEVVGSTLVTKAGLGADVFDQDGTGAVGTYTLTIMVSDGTYADDGDVVINILDSNDMEPVFNMSSYTFNISEGDSGIIDSVVASDGDLTSPNNNVTYTITGGNDEGLFSIDGVDGAISLTDQVKLLQYELTVTATDGGTPANSVTANVVVNVDPNVDECASNPCQNGATCRPNINYYWCDCAEGWTGITCSINIDECDPDPCQNNGTCVDGVASYTCDCQPGRGGENCTQACTGHTYGANCAQTCSCNDSHVAKTTAAQAQKCNIVSGACVCNVSWTGTSCDDDAIECGQGAAVCSVNNTVCQDTFGNYHCICATGYTPGTSGDCVTDESVENPLILPAAVVDAAKARGSNVAIVAVTLNIKDCQSINLVDPDEYNTIKSSLESQHIQQNLGISVRVYNIRCGSLNYELFVETDNTTAATMNLSHKLKDLLDNGTMTVAGQSAAVQDMIVGSNVVTANNRLCSIYESLSPCRADYTCQVEDGTPRCREIKDDSTDVILGVGIGVGVGGLLLVGVLLACIVMWQRKSRREKYMRPRRSGVYADRIKRQPYDNDRYDRRHNRSHDRIADIYNSGFDDRFDDRYADRPSASIPYAKPAPRMHDQMYDNKDVIVVPYKHTDDFY